MMLSFSQALEFLSWVRKAGDVLQFTLLCPRLRSRPIGRVDGWSHPFSLICHPPRSPEICLAGLSST